MNSCKYTFILLAFFIPDRLVQASLFQEDEKASSLIAFEDTVKFLSQMEKHSKGFGERWIVMPDGNGHPVYGTMEKRNSESDDSRSELTHDQLVKNVKLFLYTLEHPEPVKVEPDELEKIKFNSSNSIRIICHGWMADSNSSIVQDIKNAYLAENYDNVIGVDWGSIANDFFYPAVALSTYSIGKYLGQIIDNMVEVHGIRHNDFHVIGHSLGAHIASFAGTTTKEKLGRITGLDPALPGFQYIQGPEGRLDASDATFVDVIHTCSGLLGMSVPAGHVDFYPNGGSPFQPGCCNHLLLSGQQACSHSRAHEFFSESITKKSEFLAVKCKDWESFKHNKCDEIYTLMGEHVSKNVSGIFYLKTNEVHPFSKGFNGTIF